MGPKMVTGTTEVPQVLQRQSPPKLPQKPATAQTPSTIEQNRPNMTADTKNTQSAVASVKPANVAAAQTTSPQPHLNTVPNAEAKSSGVRPPVALAKLQLRHRLVLVSFVLCVIFPPIMAAVYLWGFAADQYHSKVGFSVRSEEGGNPLSMLGGLIGASNSSSSDTDILFEFIASQNLVEALDKELDLRAIWSKPKMDPFYSLSEDATLEELADYWKTMVHLSSGKSPGLIEVEVKAFTPEDAHLIATRLFEKSSDMINDLSAIARADSIRYARTDLDEAEARLRNARSALADFRTRNNLVDPTLDVQSQAGLISTLQSQQAAALIELDFLRETVPATDPRIAQSERRIRIIEERIEAERKKTGASDNDSPRPYAEIISEYERLTVEREFAQQAYVSALASYDVSVAESRRQSRYLAAYMEPSMAQSAIYPKRPLALATFTAFLILAWSVGLLIFYSIRDRR